MFRAPIVAIFREVFLKDVLNRASRNLQIPYKMSSYIIYVKI